MKRRSHPISMLFRPGDSVGPYVVRSHAGAGRASELFVATAAGQEEELLLEIMAAPGAAKERERFAQQGQVLALVKHPNAVRILGAGALDDDRVWLARERFPARTLAERLQDRTQPPLDVRLGWIEQVCYGLDAAHRAGIVHRNLCPESILIGPGDMVKIDGFAYARLAKVGVVTTTDHEVGSTAYSSLEHIRGEEVDARADLYSLGVLLFKLVTGVHPFGREPGNVIEAVRFHAEGTPVPVRALAPDASSTLEALLLWMLQRAPMKRPESVLVVCERLRRERDLLGKPLLRETRNAAKGEKPLPFAATVPMRTANEEAMKVTVATPPGQDRDALLPAARASAATATPPAVPPAPPPDVQQPPVAPPGEPVVWSDARPTNEPVSRDTRGSRPTTPPSRWAQVAAVGAGVLTFAGAVVVTGAVLLGRLPGLQGPAGKATTAPRPAAIPPAPTPGPVAAPAPTASSSARSPVTLTPPAPQAAPNPGPAGRAPTPPASATAPRPAPSARSPRGR